MGQEGTNVQAVDGRVREAFAHWTRGVFGAPFNAGVLISQVAVRDEVIERLVTQVTRRTVREMRTSTNQRRAEARRVDPATVDPFAFTNETLRVASQYVTQCAACMASGAARCSTCVGTGRMACRNCSGSGKQRSEKTGRPIQCKICKASGRVTCGGCSGSGSVSCRACTGSGHELSWLQYETHELWLVNVAPESPIVIAHRALRESRFLRSDDLADFTIVEQKENLQGRVSPVELAPQFHHLLDVQASVVDRRVERIVAQQYYRLAVERRDVTYDMAGTSGTVVLSGKQLLGSTTSAATKPINRRLFIWAFLVGAIGVIAFLMREAFVGQNAAMRQRKRK